MQDQDSLQRIWNTDFKITSSTANNLQRTIIEAYYVFAELLLPQIKTSKH